MTTLTSTAWLLVSGAVAQDLSWDTVAEGLQMAVWEPASQCEGQVPALIMVKVDPKRFRFATYNYLDEKLPAPLTIKEWQRRTGAKVIFNAGLFRDDYSYMGLLFKDGRSLGSRRHPQWHGLFVAEPVSPGQKKAGVLDLSVDEFAIDQPAYREAAQALMLLDRHGKTRVRRTGKLAHQTVVGEDRDGHIVLIKTADVVALWELAECLRNNLPGMQDVMAMDGGASSDVLIGEEWPVRRADPTHGAPETWQRLVDGSGMRHIPLPSVIGVLPREGG